MLLFAYKSKTFFCVNGRAEEVQPLQNIKSGDTKGVFKCKMTDGAYTELRNYSKIVEHIVSVLEKVVGVIPMLGCIHGVCVFLSFFFLIFSFFLSFFLTKKIVQKVFVSFC